jgi:hypothetical protein
VAVATATLRISIVSGAERCTRTRNEKLALSPTARRPPAAAVAPVPRFAVTVRPPAATRPLTAVAESATRSVLTGTSSTTWVAVAASVPALRTVTA